MEALKDYRTVITGGPIRSDKDLRALEKTALGFLEKYAPKPERRPRKRGGGK